MGRCESIQIRTFQNDLRNRQRWLQRLGETEPQPIELLGGILRLKNLYVVQLAVWKIETRRRGCEVAGSVPESDRPALGEDDIVPDRSQSSTS